MVIKPTVYYVNNGLSIPLWITHTLKGYRGAEYFEYTFTDWMPAMTQKIYRLNDMAEIPIGFVGELTLAASGPFGFGEALTLEVEVGRLTNNRCHGRMTGMIW
jgi:hypothetical protein